MTNDTTNILFFFKNGVSVTLNQNIVCIIRNITNRFSKFVLYLSMSL